MRMALMLTVAVALACISDGCGKCETAAPVSEQTGALVPASGGIAADGVASGDATATATKSCCAAKAAAAAEIADSKDECSVKGEACEAPCPSEATPVESAPQR